MFGKIIGGTLLIIGTSIGAGLLALPMATAGGGFVHSIGLFIGAWLVMTFGAFYILEVNLWLPEHTHMISMAKATLGSGGRLVTWITYLLLFYALLSAYTAGGSDLTTMLLHSMHLPVPQAFGACLFVIIFGIIVHGGIRTVDRTNRLLMTVKMSAYLLLIFLVAPHATLPRLTEGEMPLLQSAVMVVITSFGYSPIIPNLRTYFNSNVNALRLAVGIGSFIPLLCYLAWNFAVQGSVERGALMQMAASPHAVSDLTLALSASGRQIISSTVHLFTTICVTTAFLGASLCLWDFLADGLPVDKKTQKGRWQVTLLTFIPPLVLVLFWPGIFVKALAYAGVICVILLMLLPGLMAWSGRYVKKYAAGYRVWGGRWVLALEIILAAVLTVFGFIQVL